MEEKNVKKNENEKITKNKIDYNKPHKLSKELEDRMIYECQNIHEVKEEDIKK